MHSVKTNRAAQNRLQSSNAEAKGELKAAGGFNNVAAMPLLAKRFGAFTFD